jgi:glycosyltransferase involved in cell wall biosynthesis
MSNPGPRIGLDYTAAAHQQAGIGRYVRELTRALAALHSEADFHLFVAGARSDALSPPPGKSTSRATPLSERTLARLWYRARLPLPVELWTGPVDIFHAADFALPPTRPTTQTVVSVPDLAFERYPEETMPGMLEHLRRVVPRSAQRADRVIAISAATRDDLQELYGIPAEKIAVTPLGVEERFNTHHTDGENAALRQCYNLPEGPFVLTVGTLQPRKNHRRLVEALARVEPPTDLVIAGSAGWVYDEVQETVEQLGLTQRVTFTGYVDDADLPALYRAATVFAYPALYEGFGLPVLEAMACGTPVVTSRTSSLPEVTGPDAALLVDPLDVDSIAAALTRLLTDSDMRADLRVRGTERAAGFTWEATAAATWAVYESLLNG